MKLLVKAKLDPGFKPLALVIREMKRKTAECGKNIVIGVERTKGCVTVYKTRIFPEGTGHDRMNFRYVERIAKCLLWVAGGYKIIIAGSEKIAAQLKKAYTRKGLRAFDVDFFETVYERPFEVVSVPLSRAPKNVGGASSIGRHLEGCRIGFDAGGSTERSRL